MQWWHDVALREHLDDLLAHCNHAMDIKNRPLVTNICSLYYHALNKFWTGHNQQNGELKRGDISSFAAILQAMPEESKVIFLAAEAVRSLVALDPAVINLSEKHDATKVHRKLKNSFRDLDAHSPGASVDGTLKKFAELLYVIRCNFMHGEKTPYGPNLHKSQRDGEVSKLTVPVQMIILDLLLDRPGEKLVAYGTLQPDGCNAEILKTCEGTWESCMVNGELFEKNGLPIFKYRPELPAINARLLKAPGLAQFWERLDQFEGKGYARHLIPVQTKSGWSVAYVYEQIDLGT